MSNVVMKIDEQEWLLCPVCKNKTRIKIREDTILKNFPLFCPKCKQESIVSVNQLHTFIIKGVGVNTKIT